MRRILLAAILLAGAIAFIAWYHGREFIDHPRAGSSIIAFGDSLTAGVGALPGEDYASLLEKRLSIVIVNAGQSGDTTETARERFAEDVIEQDPRIVIILLGGNDVLRNVPVAQAMANLGGMIDELHTRGAGVLLIGIRGRGIFSDQYTKRFAELAEEKHVSFVPNILEGVFGNPDLMADQIHPNSKGYVIVADRIEPVLRKMLE